MALEIERKFLLLSDAWRKNISGSSRIIQGYLTSSGTTVRIRIMDDGAFLTLKGKPQGIARREYEYPVPIADAAEILENMCVGTTVEKTRYTVPANDGMTWEIDEYHGENAPLFTAEIELPDAETHIDMPEWLGSEISDDSRYTNRSLSRCPYSQWQEDISE